MAINKTQNSPAQQLYNQLWPVAEKVKLGYQDFVTQYNKYVNVLNEFNKIGINAVLNPTDHNMLVQIVPQFKDFYEGVMQASSGLYNAITVNPMLLDFHPDWKIEDLNATFDTMERWRMWIKAQVMELEPKLNKRLSQPGTV